MPGQRTESVRPPPQVWLATRPPMMNVPLAVCFRVRAPADVLHHRGEHGLAGLGDVDVQPLLGERQREAGQGGHVARPGAGPIHNRAGLMAPEEVDSLNRTRPGRHGCLSRSRLRGRFAPASIARAANAGAASSGLACPSRPQ